MAMQMIRAMIVPEGDGVEVKRLMPVAGLRNFDPFVLCDHFDISGGGFPDHPHRGFEAITYMFEGAMKHKDNLGNQGTVYAGGAQRFTAGKGIVHSEMPDVRAAGVQLWINLPKRLKQLEPSYQQVDGIGALETDGVSVRCIVGVGGSIQLHTDVEYLDVNLAAGSKWDKTICAGFRGFVYVVEGCIHINGEQLNSASAVFVDELATLSITANKEARVLWCFGQPHGEPIDQNGSFVD